MKNIVILAGALFAVASFADRGGFIPNSYECVGLDHTSVHYTTTSFTGKPTIRVEFDGDIVKLPPIPNLRQQESVLGTLVSVTDNSKVPVDGPVIHYTLVVPRIELKDTASTVEFSTILVQTSVSNPFFRPTFNGNKVVQRNESRTVNCTADFKTF